MEQHRFGADWKDHKTFNSKKGFENIQGLTLTNDPVDKVVEVITGWDN